MWATLSFPISDSNLSLPGQLVKLLVFTRKITSMEPSGGVGRQRNCQFGVKTARVTRGLDKVPYLGLSDRGEREGDAT